MALTKRSPRLESSAAFESPSPPIDDAPRAVRGKDRVSGIFNVARKRITLLLVTLFFVAFGTLRYEFTRFDLSSYAHDALVDKTLMSTGHTQTVQWDRNSLYIRNKPVFIISGEFHYWRLPVQELYLDVFQKLRATGHNAVSIYFHWGYHSLSEKQSVYLGVGRDIQAMLDAAKLAGLYVIARPGPYIHGETTGGGIPGWLLNREGVEIRTIEPQYTHAWQKYFSELLPILARNQIDRGGNVIAVQIENEYMDSDLFPTARQYMEMLSASVRKAKIVVPIFHNDLNKFKSFIPRDYEGVTDLYGVDSYPKGFNCQDIVNNFNVVTDYREYLSNISTGSPNFVPEFQGGAFDHWGGPGYDNCAEMTGPQFVSVFYKNNVAQKFTMMSYYMGFGGTNWGGLASPGVYTSYDYGAAISEARIVRDKANEAKLLFTFMRASPSLLKSQFVLDSNNYAYTDNHDVFVTELRDPDSLTGYYVVRSSETNSRDGKAYRIKVRTLTEGEIQIPHKGSLTLPARESRVIVTDYSAGPLQFGYSTMEVFTWTIVDEKPVLILYGDLGDLNELSIRQHGDVAHKFYNIRGNAEVLNKDVRVAATLENDLRFTFVLDGERRAVVQSHDYILALFNRPDIYKVWAPALLSNEDPDTPVERQVIVIGPYLVRNVTIEDFGKALNIYGDLDLETNDDSTIEVYADSKYATIKWNGIEMKTRTTKFMSRKFTVRRPSANLEAVSIPDLRLAEWRGIDSLPEIESTYDDSEWTVADKNVSANRWHEPKSYPVLYPGEYGFHVGTALYRGRFSGKDVTGVELEIWGGVAFGFTAWLNGKYLSSFRGTADDESCLQAITFPEGYVSETAENVLVILADRMGYELDNGVTYRERHSTHRPRGVRLARLTSSSQECECEFSKWTIQGNAGGERFDDLLRAPYNEGGVYAQRIGAHFSYFNDFKWPVVTPYTNQLPGALPRSPLKGAGVRFYRTTVPILVSSTMDVPLGIRVRAAPDSGVRVEIFVNGWQFGKYVSDIGPQDEFPIPPGIINTRGDNTISLQIWAVDNNATAGLELLEIVPYGRYISSIGPIEHDDYKGWPVERAQYLVSA